MKYDPKIHSQIHLANTKPVHVGWYIAKPVPVLRGMIRNKEDFAIHDLFFFDSVSWRYDDIHSGGCRCTVQDRAWFGLREKP